LSASLAQLGGILDKGPNAAPRRQHIPSSHGDVLAEPFGVEKCGDADSKEEGDRYLVEVVRHLFENE
jgi:hypothetical protein